MMGTVLITGGSSGIGAATARLAAVRGAPVCLGFGEDATAAARVVDAITGAGGRAVAGRCDVRDESAVAALFDLAEAQLGPVSGVVNNAGITGPIGAFDEVSTETLRTVIDVNVLGALLVAREGVRRMSVQRGATGGSIVNVSSIAATLGGPNEYVWYAASKGAVDSMTAGLATEVGGKGVRVNAVSPGLIETEIHARAGEPGRVRRLAGGVPMGRGGRADEVAEAILWLLSDAASYVNGANLRVGGGR
jgi:NAD(P)-dependent dehydrogenase (short-subunit alcohol dehydrogenase family)